MDPVNIATKFEVHSFTRSWDNIGYSKKFGPSLDTPTLPFLQNFSWACVRMDPVNIPAKFEVPSYRAMLTQSAVMRLHVVRLSVCPSVTIRYRDHIRWNSSKIISLPNSLRPMRSLTPNMGDLVQSRVWMKFGRIVPEVNAHRLTDFGFDVILSRWRPWRQ